MKQADVYNRLKIPQSTWSQIENGWLVPKEAVLKKMALQMQINWGDIERALAQDRTAFDPIAFLKDLGRNHTLKNLRIQIVASTALAANSEDAIREQMASFIAEGASYHIVWCSDLATVSDLDKSIPALRDVITRARAKDTGALASTKAVIFHYCEQLFPSLADGSAENEIAQFETEYGTISQGSKDLQHFTRPNELFGSGQDAETLAYRRRLAKAISHLAPFGVYGFAYDPAVAFVNMSLGGLCQQPNGTQMSGQFVYYPHDKAQRLYVVLRERFENLKNKDSSSQ